MRLYHATTAAVVAAVLAEGFRDATDRYGTDRESTGVWLSDRPLDQNEGTAGAKILEVTLDLPEAQIAEWEWVGEPSMGYREFQIPAAIVNAAATVRAIDGDELEALIGDDSRFLPVYEPGAKLLLNDLSRNG